ncbi:MAG: NAD(P)-dependent alcohol dehydrogenase [Ignavibacteria bacterium]|nr:NAD(P)-dependent alcohol dehydrogenase [Ignavibacteria bacterium]
MRAIVLTKYGNPDVLELLEKQTPEPREHEILIKIIATPVSYADLLVRNLRAVKYSDFNMPGIFLFLARFAFGFSKPKIKVLGSEFAGEIVKVGSSVTRFATGDLVFGYLGQNMGSYTSHLCIPESAMLTTKPCNISPEQACCVPMGALMAMEILKQVPLQKGNRVLIIGASGGIGSALIQLCKLQGAHVTGICGTERVSYIQNLGVDNFYDYQKSNFLQSDNTYDFIFDVLGRYSFKDCKARLTTNGKMIYISFKTKQLLQMIRTHFFGKQKVLCLLGSEKLENLEKLKALIESGSYTVKHGKVFPMNEAPKAHRYAESGKKDGPVIIKMI